MPGDLVVPQVVPELNELVEDHQVLARLAQFPALVEDLLDVELAARREDHLSGHTGEPLKALLAHSLRQNGDGLAGH